LLAAVLLDILARRGVSILAYDSGPTSSDLLSRLAAQQRAPALNEKIVTQNVENVSKTKHAPAGNTETQKLKSGGCVCFMQCPSSVPTPNPYLRRIYPKSSTFSLLVSYIRCRRWVRPECRNDAIVMQQL
jgi:hypothetical protein